MPRKAESKAPAKKSLAEVRAENRAIRVAQRKNGLAAMKKSGGAEGR